MKRYAYNGPVTENDICVARRWKAETMATTEKRALSNLTFQFKHHNNRPRNAKISLDARYLKEESNGGLQV